MIGTMDLVIPGICGLGMHLRLDGFRLIYAAIAAFMWICCGLFSLEYMSHYRNRGTYYVFFWITFLATVGVFLSADLYTAFIFFEIMSFTSYVWVAFDGKRESLRAAQTYLAVAVISGLVLLMGLFLLYHILGTLEMDEIGPAAGRILNQAAAAGQVMASGQAAGQVTASGQAAGQASAGRLYAAGGMLLFGFGAKAGCFPLHIWLPKAHPVAPAPASALLSGILTKAGVFGVVVVSCNMFGSDGGWGLLVAALGLVTMFLGALLALFSVNLKRTLACSSVSQIGFIFTGIGMSCLLRAVGADGQTAVRGAFLHMVNHSLLKLVLFLCAGAVFMNLHQLNLNDIRGFGRNKPCLCFCFLMGALGISGIPLWNGYVSKTLLHEGIVEYGGMIREGAGSFISPHAAGAWQRMGAVLTSPGIWKGAEWLFLITGGMTLAYMAKLFIALFVERHPSRQEEFDSMSKSYMNPVSRLALLAPAILLPVMGLFPQVFMDRLADWGQGFFGSYKTAHGAAYFSADNLKGALISIGIGVVIYVLVVRGFLMRKGGEGNDAGIYEDCWPAWLDLEELVYRPVIQTMLPAVFGAVCQAVDRYLLPVAAGVLLAVSSLVCRAMDQLADGLILLARKTTHRQTAGTRVPAGDGWLACVVGQTIDRILDIARFMPGRKKQARTSVIPGLIEAEEELKRTGKLVEESFSFGLMLFCIGLCLTLGYLLAVFFKG